MTSQYDVKGTDQQGLYSSSSMNHKSYIVYSLASLTMRLTLDTMQWLMPCGTSITITKDSALSVKYDDAYQLYSVIVALWSSMLMFSVL
jgi:hypothetical protein